MKSKITLFFSIVVLFITQISNAQQNNIRGTITDQESLPLPGVNIIIKGTTSGTQSDFDGNYSISAEANQTLVYSYLGYTTQEVIVGADNNINIKMVEDAALLDEVVVTAFGIKREKRALGFGQTTVGSDALEQRPDADVARVLQGKVAGVGISQSGVVGGESSIVIRDKSLLTGGNSPLIVVDGVPFNSDTDNASSFAGEGSTSSNRLLDINPENIAEMSVLKGLAASALYGNRGINGVILITTKSGMGITGTPKKLEMTVTTSTYFTNVANIPNFQNKYGSGYYLGNLNGANGSWGPLFDSELLVPHILSNNSALQNSFPQFFGEENFVPYVGTPNNVKDFFRTGVGRSISVSASKSSENTSLNTSFSNTNEEGFIPLNSLTRNNFSLGGSAILDNNFSVNATFNYVGTETKAPPISAANGSQAYSIFERLLYIPRNFDIMNLPYQDPVTGGNVFYLPGEDNPLWILNNAKSTQKVTRFFNNVSLNYKFSDNMSLIYRVGLDTYNDNQTYYVNKGSSLGVAALENGYLRQLAITRTQWDHTLILNTNFNISESIGFNANIGANSNRRTFTRTGASFTEQVVYGFINSSNFSTGTGDDPYVGQIDRKSENNVVGLFAQTEFDLNDYLYLTLSARNDWASTLENDYNSQFYPSASVSFVPTSAFENLRSDALTFLKIRGNIASGAQFPDPYSTRPTLNVDANTFIDGNGNSFLSQTITDFLPNPNLRAALITDYEIGLESRFWKNRMGLTVSAYNRIAEDQIVIQPLDPSTGYTDTTTNIARVDTEGIEIEFDISPLKSDNFEWNISSNFFAYETIVETLGGDVDRFPIAGFTTLGNFAIEGEPLGVIVGSYALRDPITNQLLVNPTTGMIISNSDIGEENKIIGDPNPDWTATVINTFTYKGFSLGAQLEYRHGGDIYSLTAKNLQFRGVVDIEGYENRENFYAGAVPGVLAEVDGDGNFTGNAQTDANGNPIQNTILMPIEDVIFNNVDLNDAENVYDGTTVRLREISLGYELPSRLLDRSPFGSISFRIFGQNLWYKAVNFPDNLNFDPETLSSGGVSSGLDFQTAPSSKRIGFSIKASF